VRTNDDIRHYIYILMHAISTKFQPTMKVNIHNLCPDFKLMDGRYFSTGVDWDKYIEKEVNSGNIMSVGLIPFLSEFEGALTYELQNQYVKR
jgi:hypothetical protein